MGSAIITSDCSGSVIQAFHYAKRITGQPVKDPAKQGWSGYGNTDLYEDDWPKVTSGQYQIGDLGHYQGHVTLCIKPGDWDWSDWWSFGSEPPSSASSATAPTSARSSGRSCCDAKRG